MLASGAMHAKAARFPRLPAGLAGLFLAVLALVSQLAVGSLAPVDALASSQQAELDALTALCRTAPPADGRHDPAHRHLPDCAPGVSRAALVLPGFVLAPMPVPPAPSVHKAARLVSLLSARGPPSHASHLGFPRGPPVLA